MVAVERCDPARAIVAHQDAVVAGGVLGLLFFFP